MDTEPPLKDHFVICGLGHVGYRIVEILAQFRETFVVVTREIRPEWRATVEQRAARFNLGDARHPDSLAAAHVASARAVIVVTDDDLTNIEICLDVQRIGPDIPLVVRIFDRFLAHRAEREMHVRSVLSPGLLTAPVFVAAAQGEEMIRTFDIGGVRLEVFELAFSPSDIPPGTTIADFCRSRRLHPLSITCAGGVGATGEDRPIQAGDRVTLVAAGECTERLRKDGFLPLRETQADRRHPLQRLRNTLLHPLAPLHRLRSMWLRASNVLRFAFIALHGLLIASVLIFHAFLPGHPSWVDSIYFTVTMMSTVGFGDYTLHDAPDWLKLYGCLVMVSGVALVAIFFSMVTDAIVAARVEQALGRRKTSLSGHIVVVGLGDVGTRVAEELHRAGEGVVAIERDSEHEGIQSLQDHIQVIIADAHRETAMQQANFAQARAVIVTTTDDLISLRIAHQAEMFNPKLRTIVRIYDSALANKLGSGLGIQRAVNAAQTAASTFVACALAERVEQSFMLGDRLLAIRRAPAVTGEPDPAACHFEGGLVLEEYDPCTRTWRPPTCQCTRNPTPDPRPPAPKPRPVTPPPRSPGRPGSA